MSKRNLIIEEVEWDKTSIRPIVCDFQNGKIPEGFEEHIVSQVYKDADNKLLVAVAANKQLYTKKVVQNKTHNTFIAVPNKEGTKVRLVAVDYVKLAPHVEDDVDGKTEIISSKSDMEFTNKKTKRIISEFSKLKQDVESIEDHLKETVAGVSIDETDLNISISENAFTPKINVDAESVEDVYSLNDLVSENVLESLTEEVERIFNDDEDNMGTCDFVSEMLNQFDDINTDKKRRACQIWLYVDCLFKFYHTSAKNVSTKKYKACNYSELVNEDILLKFTTVSAAGRHRSNFMKDKCICYILVLCVLNSNYSLDLNPFCKELRITAKRVVEFAKNLRFTVKLNMVNLNLPLPPVVKPKPKRR